MEASEAGAIVELASVTSGVEVVDDVEGSKALVEALGAEVLCSSVEEDALTVDVAVFRAIGGTTYALIFAEDDAVLDPVLVAESSCFEVALLDEDVELAVDEEDDVVELVFVPIVGV